MVFSMSETQSETPTPHQPTLRDMIPLSTPFEAKASPGGAVRLPRYGPPYHQAAREPCGDASEPGLVQPLPPGRRTDAGNGGLK
jgi:hypothetical protein